MGARETALNALIACRKEKAWSNGVLKDYIRRDRLDGRDAALATRLCYGVLQNRGKLDFYLKQLVTGRVKDLHPAVRDILHMGLYQIYEMDKIPGSAAVNEAVTLAKKYCRGMRNAPGLVNGVLRNALRTKGTLKEPTAWEDKYSHPKRLIEVLSQSIPSDKLEKMLIADNETPPMTVQVNTLQIAPDALVEKLKEQGVTAQLHDWLPNSLVLENTGNLEQLPSFRDGDFYVQDAAAQLSVACAQLPRNRDIFIMDCCAAPGGKTFAAAIAMGNRGRIFACDIHPHKIQLIENGARRLGLKSVQALQQDASVCRPEWVGKMDAVLADVPCSGYGIIRKKPDIRDKDPKDMESLPQLQLAILTNQAKYVKPGGILMYSTCTVLRRENEDIVHAFLAQHSDYSLEPLTLPERMEQNTSGMLTLIPGEYDTDGFFIARLRRKP